MIRISVLVLAVLVLGIPRVAAEPAESGEWTPPDASVFGEGANLDALNWDVSRMAPSGTRLRGSAAPEARADWSRTEKKDGSSALTVKRALPTEWDSKVGLDLNLAEPQNGIPPIDPLRPVPSHSTGAAWATITAPSLDMPAGWDRATLDARVDPSTDQRRLGTTLSKSVPLNDNFSVTLNNGHALTHQGAHPGWLDAAAGAPAPAEIYSTDGSAKLNVLPTHTRIGIGASRSSTDSRWLRTLSTEQTLFGDVSVTGTISESAEGPAKSSLTAGFKKTW